MKLLLDEHLPPRIAIELRHQGHDVVAVAGRPDLRRSTDDALWSAAGLERRAIVTRDVGDFMRLAARDAAIGRRHPGLVLIHGRQLSRAGRDVGRLVTALRLLLTANSPVGALEGRIVWLAVDGR